VSRLSGRCSQLHHRPMSLLISFQTDWKIIKIWVVINIPHAKNDRCMNDRQFLLARSVVNLVFVSLLLRLHLYIPRRVIGRGCCVSLASSLTSTFFYIWKHSLPAVATTWTRSAAAWTARRAVPSSLAVTVTTRFTASISTFILPTSTGWVRSWSVARTSSVSGPSLRAAILPR
jgi:hypothetical protein